MYIKNILISGFRSYREQAFEQELSPKNNVIVGKNGAGKSNFFAAIQFVLCEKFMNLSSVERKDLFHVGSGRPALPIFVEIIFDNSDGRLVIPGKSAVNEVRIRRTLGLKQDEFRVNDKRFTATDIRQLLESAGFSSTNPYYIVEQGQISSLANMSDEERFQLIKDVAGTRVYEVRRKESEKILEETEVQHEKIGESIAQLEERLEELRSESDELMSFQEIDKKRKCVQYCILNSDLNAAREELRRLDDERNSYMSRSGRDHYDIDEAKAIISEAESEIRNCDQRILRLEGELQDLDTKRGTLMREKEIVQLNCMSSLNTMKRTESVKTNVLKRVGELNKQIAETNAGLKKKLAIIQQEQLTVDQKSEELSAIEGKLKALEARRARQLLFKNKQERDNWLAEESNRNRKTIENYKHELKFTCSEIQKVEKQIEDEETEQKNWEESLKKSDSVITELKSKYEETMAFRNSLSVKKGDLWREQSALVQTVRTLRENHNKARSQLEKVIRSDVRQGLQSLKEVLDELADPSLTNAVHGQLIELIGVSNGYETAVEVTAGNSLFNVVVDSFEVSAILLENMNSRKKPGRISFFPMDTCRGTVTRFGEGVECSSLADHIICDPKFAGIVAELFGNTAVVTSIADGENVSKKYACDAVTLDGDQVSRRGGITGGYIESRSLKLSAFKYEKVAAADFLRGDEALKKITQELDNVNQALTGVVTTLSSLKTEMSSITKSKDGSQVVEQHAQRKAALDRQKDKLYASKKQLEDMINTAQVNIATYQHEGKEAFKSAWSEGEQRELEALVKDVDDRRMKLSKLQRRSAQLAAEVRALEDMRLNLNVQLTATKKFFHDSAQLSASNTAITNEKENLDDDISFNSQQANEVYRLLDETRKEKLRREEEVEKLRSGYLEALNSIQERRDFDGRTLMQQAHCIRRRDGAAEKIRQLGVIPKEAETYSGLSREKLIQTLKECNKAAEKYAHINRKAVDQYNTLMETKNGLVAQKEDLQNELKSIRDLMDHLDCKKDEAVERTYKQIQLHFEQVFKELVTTDDCYGKLQLIMSNTRKEAGEDPYVAVQIKVSFGLGAAVTDLKQLSGGQKSLVALALIFAIQRCDPAPFYLFDEIDAALDTEYRASVAKLLSKESGSCQFITATFKNEMLDVADHVLGVFFHNKISRIQAITVEEGNKLLKQAVVEERKRVREHVE
ncbi:structural maintenance of chromosome 3, putative [Trypanosoma brucei brucei TREU927]|uniref:Structural maintenance of chromosomes protein n=1 Tax=Trypanosoma brucei brucei (strain 927/4 GUTat10.1) TaxID=185431 RepID=Q57UB5_TRYB2|nr:structural maintenance of chromosome 3, putative [Trypanosoma brucei brucei TREU927]AAX70804.1 structural maintenance of chromosome 3, putative [Trypanosoma brucei]AAZ11462.1 structural maintenance of chromosome 3, putative [Trypanosoma brucei brucei TREU927]